MKRIDGLDRAVDLFGTGKDGFKAQVPGVSLATQVNEKWFNHVQESLVRTIEAAGLDLSEADYDQFTNAILSLLSGKVTQGGGAGQIAGVVKIGAAAGSKLKADVDGVDFGNLAFEGWVSAQIADLVNSSPAALDTLKELAEALGDDPTFAVTMTNALAGKERKFDSGTRMLFQQTAAPVGWTKITTHNDKALRVVSGSVVNGGTVAFSAAFVAGNVGNTTLTLAQIPVIDGVVGALASISGGLEDGQATPNYPIESRGGGGSHTHTLNLDVSYVDIIIASKD